MIVLTLCLFLAATARCQDPSNPCEGMTFGDCQIAEENIIDSYPFHAELCQSMCHNSVSCSFWRAFENDTLPQPECLFLRTNYHQVTRVSPSEVVRKRHE